MELGETRVSSRVKAWTERRSLLKVPKGATPSTRPKKLTQLLTATKMPSSWSALYLLLRQLALSLSNPKPGRQLLR